MPANRYAELRPEPLRVNNSRRSHKNTCVCKSVQKNGRAPAELTSGRETIIAIATIKTLNNNCSNIPKTNKNGSGPYQDHFRLAFFRDIFSSADFRPVVSRLAIFRLAYFRLTIFRLGIFSSIFRLCIFSSVYFFVRAFFRSYIFSSVHFFVRTFFRLCIFSSTHNFVCAIFRPRRFSFFPTIFRPRSFRPRRFSPLHSSSLPFFVHAFFPSYFCFRPRSSSMPMNVCV